MDGRYGDFNKFNRGDFRRGPSRGGSRGSDRDHLRGMMEDVRKKVRANSEDFRDAFRGNVMGSRDNIQRNRLEEKSRRDTRDTADGRDGDDKEGFTEEFHERKVDYHKDVRRKKADDDGRETQEETRAARDERDGFPGGAMGCEEDFRE